MPSAEEVGHDAKHWSVCDTDIALGLAKLQNVVITHNHGIRGMLYDTDARLIVAHGMKQQYRVCLRTDVLTTVTEANDEGDVTSLVIDGDDESAVNTSLSVPLGSNSNLQYGFEGVSITVCLHRGKVLRSPPLKLRADKSYWGLGCKFDEIIGDVAFPSDDDMFPLKRQYSSAVHRFLVVHRSILNVSRLKLAVKGFVVYLGCEDRVISPAIDESEIDRTVWRPPINEDLGLSLSDGVLYYAPSGITIDQANRYLARGFSDGDSDENGGKEISTVADPRVSTGEFVMLSCPDMTAGLGSGRHALYRLHSRGYEWRASMKRDRRGADNPNVVYQFFQLTDHAQCHVAGRLSAPALVPYSRRFVWLIGRTQSSIALLRSLATGQTKPVTQWIEPSVEGCVPIEQASARERIINIAICLVMSVPLHRQGLVAQSCFALLSGRDALVERICSAQLDRRVYLTRRLHVLRECAERRCLSAKAANHRAQQATLMNRQVRSFIESECGDSLYTSLRRLHLLNVEL